MPSYCVCAIGRDWFLCKCDLTLHKKPGNINYKHTAELFDAQ